MSKKKLAGILAAVARHCTKQTQPPSASRSSSIGPRYDFKATQPTKKQRKG